MSKCRVHHRKRVFPYTSCLEPLWLIVCLVSGSHDQGISKAWNKISSGLYNLLHLQISLIFWCRILTLEVKCNHWILYQRKKWRFFLSAEKIALVLVTFLDTATCLIVLLLPWRLCYFCHICGVCGSYLATLGSLAVTSSVGEALRILLTMTGK